jgi:5-methylcytosine-specific restriction endonuclease McrA
MRHKSEPEHGTRSGYDWHRRDMKEDPCQLCTDAERAYWKNQRVIRKEQINTLRRDWRFRTPNARRHFRRNNTAPGNYSEKDVLEVYGLDCHICQTPIDLNAPRKVGHDGWEKGLHIDHVYPLSKGGLDTLENVRPAHGKCNVIKWATIG